MLKNAFPGIFHAQPTKPNDKREKEWNNKAYQVSQSSHTKCPATALK
jgi:hypothetical protein